MHALASTISALIVAMQDPVVAGDGWCYERSAIDAWLRRGGGRSPMTRAPLASAALVPNHPLRSAIREWQERRGGEWVVGMRPKRGASAAGLTDAHRTQLSGAQPHRLPSTPSWRSVPHTYSYHSYKLNEKHPASYRPRSNTSRHRSLTREPAS